MLANKMRLSRFYDQAKSTCSVYIAQDFATDVLSSCLLMIEDAGRGGLCKNMVRKPDISIRENKTYEDDVAETTRGKQQVDPVFNLGDLDVETRGDNTSLVQAPIELYDNLSGAMIVDNLKFANVAYRKQCQ